MDLAEFLLARIAEDEDAAREAAELIAGWRHPDMEGWAGFARARGRVTFSRSAESHIARWGPARVLTECDARRRILDQVEEAQHRDTRPEVAWIEVSRVTRYLLCLLALPYADHPDYRSEWKP